MSVCVCASSNEVCEGMQRQRLWPINSVPFALHRCQVLDDVAYCKTKMASLAKLYLALVKQERTANGNGVGKATGKRQRFVQAAYARF